MRFKLADLEEVLESIGATQAELPPGFLVRRAHLQESDSPREMLTAHATALPRKPSDLRHMDYGKLRLDEDWVEYSNLATLMKSEAHNDDPRFGGTKAPEPFLERHHELVRRLMGWPGWEISLRRPGVHRPDWGERAPLLMPHKRPFRNAALAVNSFVWDEPDQGPPDSARILEEDEFIAYIPDRRARISNAYWTGNRLQFSVEGTAASDVHVLCTFVDVDGSSKFVELHSESAPVQVPDNSRRIELYLLNESGERFNSATLTMPGEGYTHEGETADATKRALTDMGSGENERIEFKPFIKLNDQKWQEVTETVVAFANTQGGRLYLGVDDNGVPQSGRALCVACNAGPDDAAQAQEAYLKKRIRNSIKPVPNIETQWLELHGEPVLLAVVSPGTEGPYSTVQNDVFVRRGASNIKPDPRSELPLLFPMEEERNEQLAFPDSW